MLGLSRRYRSGGAAGVREPPPSPNGILAWGQGKSGALGGGYHSIGWFGFPQTVAEQGDAAQVAIGSQMVVLDRQGRVHTVGGKEGAGRGTRQGVGGASGGAEEGAEEGEDQLVCVWFQVTGGYPLYPEALLKTKVKSFLQPTGPPSVLIPSKADHEEGRASWHPIAVSTAENHVLVLTSDGRVLSWGSNQGGEVGCGWEWHSPKSVEEAEQGKWPTSAPWWMQVSGPGPGTPDPRFSISESEMLKDVIAVDAGQEMSVFLKSNGEVWYAGSPTGGGSSAIHLFAAKDTLWTPDPANKPIAICTTKRGYLLLLEDGTPRYVGNITEYCAGNGVLESKATSTRELATPLLADKTVPKKVIAIAKGDYAIKLLKDNGVVYTAGSNQELQQGVAGFSRTEPQPYCTPMASLNEGGRKVVAISGGGETVHYGAALNYLRIPGANAGDGFLYLLDDTSVRVSGMGFAYNTALPERWEGVGNTGAGDSQNHALPVEPLGGLRGIVQIAADVVHQVIVQQPGAPGPLTVEPVVLSAGVVQVNWSTPPGAEPGSLPLWRQEEGFVVELIGLATGVKYRASALPGTTRSYTFTGVARGQLYEVRVVAQTVEARPAVVGNAVAQLTAPLSTSGAITSLPVTPPEALVGGTTLLVTSGSHAQSFTVSANLEPGTTFIPIKSATPNFAYPIGSAVQLDGTLKTAGTRWGTAAWGRSKWGSGALEINWQDPSVPEPGFIVEYQHRGVVRASGKTITFPLSAPLSTAAPISALSATAPEAFSALDQVLVVSGGHSQVFELGAKVAKGATSIPVKSTLPSFAFPAGSEVFKVKNEDWQRLEPDAGPNDRGVTVFIPPPVLEGVTGESVRVRVFGSYGGCFKTRIREVFVP